MNRFFLAAVAVFMMAGSAEAGVRLIGSQAALDASGTVAQSTNWDSYGGDFYHPGSPVVAGALRFEQGAENLIGGVDDYGMLRPLFTDDLIAGTTIRIAGNFDLFGLNAGNFRGSQNASFQVTTNLGSYLFTPFIADASYGGALTFVGFRADAGEYLTSVRVFGNGATGFTDVQIGNAGAVPEPATWAMLIVGFGLVGASMRRRASAFA